jgi:hypothetical protein
MLPPADRSLRLAVVVGLAVSLFAFVNLVWLNGRPIAPAAYGFSAEHGNIAEALARRGVFADPFGARSGPTAWEPPVFPAYLAAVFLIAGVKTKAALWVLLLLDCAWMGVTASALAWALHRQGLGRAAHWLPFILALHLLLLQRVLTLVQSPYWFIAAVSAVFLACWVAVQQPHAARGWWWGLVLLCGLIPITHLGCGLAVFGLVLFLVSRAWSADSPLRTGRKWLAGAMLALVLPAGIWSVRNRIALGSFFPVKSNGWFELWLTQEHTPTGVLDGAAVSRYHPYLDPVQRARFAELGERGYLEASRRAVVTSLRQHPARYLPFVLNRLVNAMVFTQNSTDCVVCSAPVSVDDLIRLQTVGLGARAAPAAPFFWTSLDLAPEEMPARLVAAGVAERRALYADWLRARAYAAASRSDPWHLLAGFSLSGLPLACLLLYGALKRRQTEAVVLAMAAFYLLALAPNILVTHDSNHQLLHLGLLAGFVAVFLAEMQVRIPHWRRLVES